MKVGSVASSTRYCMRSLFVAGIYVAWASFQTPVSRSSSRRSSFDEIGKQARQNQRGKHFLARQITRRARPNRQRKNDRRQKRNRYALTKTTKAPRVAVPQAPQNRPRRARNRRRNQHHEERAASHRTRADRFPAAAAFKQTVKNQLRQPRMRDPRKAIDAP